MCAGVAIVRCLQAPSPHVPAHTSTYTNCHARFSNIRISKGVTIAVLSSARKSANRMASPLLLRAHTPHCHRASSPHPILPTVAPILPQVHIVLSLHILLCQYCHCTAEGAFVLILCEYYPHACDTPAVLTISYPLILYSRWCPVRLSCSSWATAAWHHTHKGSG